MPSIDVRNIERRLNENYYSDKETFVHDIQLLFKNARLYNLPETIYVKAANELEEYMAPSLNALKDDKSK